MALNVMVKGLVQDSKVGEKIVGCFMTGLRQASRSDLTVTVKVPDPSWSLDLQRIFATIAIVGLHTLPIFKQVSQTEVEDADVRPVATRKGSHDPTQPPILDVDTKLVPESR